MTFIFACTLNDMINMPVWIIECLDIEGEGVLYVCFYVRMRMKIILLTSTFSLSFL